MPLTLRPYSVIYRDFPRLDWCFAFRTEGSHMPLKCIYMRIELILDRIKEWYQ